MTLPPCLRPFARTLIATLFFSFALVRPAWATDWTDIWYTVLEVGWGVNFVQSNNFIFATFFVHGADQQPDWYTGQMTQDVNGNWSGPLYRTTGSYFGAPFQSNQTSTVQVGTVSFMPSSSTVGTLVYNVNNVNVTKTITRLTLTTIALGGDYLGGIVSVVTGCNDSSQNGVFRAFITLTATQLQSGNLTLDVGINGGGSCKFTGTSTQEGQLFSIPNAAYTCGSFSTTASLTQIKATAQGIEGQWTAPVGQACQEAGYFSAVLQ
jgi:hypothetical protein